MAVNYKELYIYLFNQITDAIRLLDAGKYAQARSLLVCAQQYAEEKYISCADKE